MRIENDIKLDFSDVLIRPKRSTLKTRREVSLFREFEFRNSGASYHGIPIMAANMDGVGTFDMADALAKQDLFTCLVKHYDIDLLKEWVIEKGKSIQDNWAYSMGISDEDLDRLIDFVDVIEMHDHFKFVCIDVANGYTERFVEFVKKVRKLLPKHVIIAGNVVTAEMTEELILAGADIVKVGIGPGSVCTTRIKTGVGYPQLSAVIECADAAHGLGGHIIADGGCASSGDIAKAFAGGADFVMLGGMLAGHDEGGGDIKDGRVTFYGMSSDTAMEKHYGHKANYRASEGRTVTIKHRGPVDQTVFDILGGVRSACTYVGASKLKYLTKCTTFIRVNNTHNRIFDSNTVKL
jgi:GMP reductase